MFESGSCLPKNDCLLFEGDVLLNDLCGFHCQSQSELCIVKNPEDGDFHTSGDSTAGIQFHLLLSKKGVPRSLYEGGMSFTFCDTSESLSRYRRPMSLYMRNNF